MIEGETPDTDREARLLFLMDPMIAPITDAAIRALNVPPGSRGLDVGCGAGLQAMRLAEVVGSLGHVIGLDLSPRMLQHAMRLAERSGLAERVSFREGNMSRLPFADNTFDWLWSADCAGYAPESEPLSLLRELARVVRPGGSVAILFWSSQMLLPGHPVLEAHLNATRAGIAPFGEETPPECHHLLTLGRLRRAGLIDAWANTFVRTLFAPLDHRIREGLVALLQMRWGGAEPELPERERAAYSRLCHPDSPDFILDRPDYYAFFTYSLFCGQVAS